MPIVLKRMLLLALMFLLAAQAWAEKYGAIAYSPATGKWGYSNQCDSRQRAEQIAMENCPAADARVAIWVKNGWAALCRNSSGAWHSAWSSNSLEEAERIARAKVPGGKRVCWVYSGT